MNSITTMYSPKGISDMLKLPFLSERPPVTTSPSWLSIIEIDAYSIGAPEVESVTEPCTIPMAGIFGFLS